MIGAGFGRTGTSSLKAALESLGFGPCYHMTEVFAHPQHAKVWRAAGRGEPVDWNDFLAGYESVVDWPACTFYGDLMREYPDAKVLLSVRDAERWYESTRNTIYEISRVIGGSRLSRTVFGVIGLLVPAAREVGSMTGEVIWRGTFDGRFENRDHAIGVYERHNEEVRRRVPSDRLLVYEVKQGWGPLCDFLGVPEPDEPFPRLNDTAEFRRGIVAMRALSFGLPGALALLAAVILLMFQKRKA